MFVYQIARLQGHPVTQSRALVMFSIQLSNIWESHFLIFSWTMIFQLNDMEFPLPLVHNKHPHPESSSTDFWVCVPQIKHKPNYDTIHRQIIDPSNKKYTYILGISIYIWHIYIYIYIYIEIQFYNVYLTWYIYMCVVFWYVYIYIYVYVYLRYIMYKLKWFIYTYICMYIYIYIYIYICDTYMVSIYL